MQGKNHVGLAVAAPLALALAGITITPPSSITAWCMLIIGALAPDIDGGGAIARPSIFLPRVIPDWITRLLDRLGLRLARVIQAALGHRGGLHWPLWAGLMVWAGLHYELTWLVWFGAGYSLHLAGDIITVAGIPLLGPLTGRKFSLFPMRVGGRLEAIISFVLWSFILAYLLWAGWEQFGPLAAQIGSLIERLMYILEVQ
jgi:membrane-bound metal-dependent hydrolase YbcI (DUF457 family)